MRLPTTLVGLCTLLLLVGSCYASVVTAPIKCNGNTVCQVQSLEWFDSSSLLMVVGNQQNKNLKYFKSTDEGQTFAQLGTGVKQIVGYPQHPEVMFLLPTAGTSLLYTTNGGGSFQNMTLPVGSAQIGGDYFLPHPTELGWLMIVGCSDLTQKCSMYTTKNYGKTWTTSFDKTLAYETVGTPAIWGNSTTEKDLVFLLQNNYKFGYTTDYKTFTELFPEVFSFSKTKNYYWVVEGANGKSRLLSSSSRLDPTHKAKGSYLVATFPYSASFNNEDYKFLDDTTRAEYVGVHTAKMGGWGDLYTSEFDGLTFELSLANVNYKNGWYDFHRVRGLGGIYVANVVQDTTARIPVSQTLITFDNGGDWKLLVPPTLDMQGNPWPCGSFGPKCSLHLQGEAGYEVNGVPSMRSHYNAIGLIIANGNVGPAITTNVSLQSTFMSRDGGLTWSQVFPSASFFEFGNNGAITVLIPVAATQSVYYSFNQGVTTFILSTATLANTQKVIGISAEPNGTGLNFIVQGYDGNDANPYYYFSTFSLTDANLRTCDDSDYENWSPSNGLSGSNVCFMGQTITYSRRKAQSICYNQRAQSVVGTPSACGCTWEDYECTQDGQPSDRNETDGFTCTQDSSASVAEFVCEPGHKYYEFTGYQLVPDTGCELSTGLDLIGPLKTCPSKSHPAEVVAAVVVTLLVVGGIAGIVVLYFKNERFREWVQSFKGGKDSGRYREVNHVDEDDDNTV